MNPIDVWLLTGYLGAGKTTALNHLLARPPLAEQRLALVINEFGDLGVDAARLGPARRPTFEINKGSVLCVCTKTEFVQVLRTLADEVRPEAVWIEATGVADPTDLAGYLDQPGLEGRFRLRANLCLVDAARFTKVAGFLRSAVEQVRRADGIAINKVDQVGEDQLGHLRGVLAEINPHAPVCTVARGRIEPDFLAGLGHRAGPPEPATGPPVEIRAETFRTEAIVRRQAFAGAIDAMGDSLLRLKGHVRFEDGLAFVECVGPDRTESPALPTAEAGITAFTVIAFRVAPAEIRSRFEPCWVER